MSTRPVGDERPRALAEALAEWAAGGPWQPGPERLLEHGASAAMLGRVTVEPMPDARETYRGTIRLEVSTDGRHVRFRLLRAADGTEHIYTYGSGGVRRADRAPAGVTWGRPWLVRTGLATAPAESRRTALYALAGEADETSPVRAAYVHADTIERPLRARDWSRLAELCIDAPSAPDMQTVVDLLQLVNADTLRTLTLRSQLQARMWTDAVLAATRFGGLRLLSVSARDAKPGAGPPVTLLVRGRELYAVPGARVEEQWIDRTARPAPMGARSDGERPPKHAETVPSFPVRYPADLTAPPLATVYTGEALRVVVDMSPAAPITALVYRQPGNPSNAVVMLCKAKTPPAVPLRMHPPADQQRILSALKLGDDYMRDDGPPLVGQNLPARQAVVCVQDYDCAPAQTTRVVLQMGALRDAAGTVIPACARYAVLRLRIAATACYAFGDVRGPGGAAGGAFAMKWLATDAAVTCSAPAQLPGDLPRGTVLLHVAPALPADGAAYYEQHARGVVHPTELKGWFTPPAGGGDDSPSPCVDLSVPATSVCWAPAAPVFVVASGAHAGRVVWIPAPARGDGSADAIRGLFGHAAAKGRTMHRAYAFDVGTERRYVSAIARNVVPTIASALKTLTRALGGGEDADAEDAESPWKKTSAPDERAAAFGPLYQTLAKWWLMYGWSPTAHTHMEEMLMLRAGAPFKKACKKHCTETRRIPELAGMMREVVARICGRPPAQPAPETLSAIAAIAGKVADADDHTIYQVCTSAAGDEFAYPDATQTLALPYVPRIAAAATAACRALVAQDTATDADMALLAALARWLDTAGPGSAEAACSELEAALEAGSVALPAREGRAAGRYMGVPAGLHQFAVSLRYTQDSTAGTRLAEVTAARKAALIDKNRAADDADDAAVSFMLARTSARMLRALQRQYAADADAGDALCMWLRAYYALWQAYLDRAKRDTERLAESAIAVAAVSVDDLAEQSLVVPFHVVDTDARFGGLVDAVDLPTTHMDMLAQDRDRQKQWRRDRMIAQSDAPFMPFVGSRWVPRVNDGKRKRNDVPEMDAAHMAAMLQADIAAAANTARAPVLSDMVRDGQFELLFRMLRTLHAPYISDTALTDATHGGGGGGDDDDDDDGEGDTEDEYESDESDMGDDDGDGDGDDDGAAAAAPGTPMRQRDPHDRGGFDEVALGTRRDPALHAVVAKGAVRFGPGAYVARESFLGRGLALYACEAAVQEDRPGVAVCAPDAPHVLLDHVHGLPVTLHPLVPPVAGMFVVSMATAEALLHYVARVRDPWSVWLSADELAANAFAFGADVAYAPNTYVSTGAMTVQAAPAAPAVWLSGSKEGVARLALVPAAAAPPPAISFPRAGTRVAVMQHETQPLLALCTDVARATRLVGHVLPAAECTWRACAPPPGLVPEFVALRADPDGWQLAQPSGSLSVVDAVPAGGAVYTYIWSRAMEITDDVWMEDGERGMVQTAPDEFTFDCPADAFGPYGHPKFPESDVVVMRYASRKPLDQQHYAPRAIRCTMTSGSVYLQFAALHVGGQHVRRDDVREWRAHPVVRATYIAASAPPGEAPSLSPVTVHSMLDVPIPSPAVARPTPTPARARTPADDIMVGQLAPAPARAHTPEDDIAVGQLAPAVRRSPSARRSQSVVSVRTDAEDWHTPQSVIGVEASPPPPAVRPTVIDVLMLDGASPSPSPSPARHGSPESAAQSQSQNSLLEWALGTERRAELVTLVDHCVSISNTAFPWPELQTFAFSHGALPDTIVAAILRRMESVPDGAVVVVPDDGRPRVATQADRDRVSAQVARRLAGRGRTVPLRQGVLVITAAERV